MKTFIVKQILFWVGCIVFGMSQSIPTLAEQAGNDQGSVVVSQNNVAGQGAPKEAKSSEQADASNKRQGNATGSGDQGAASTSTIVTLVLVVMFFGALGGFVDGLTTDIHHNFTWGTYTKDIGSFGDALVGATSALAIFTVANSIFGELKDLDLFPGNVALSIKVIAIGVLSGYAGIRFLNPLTRRVAEQIATEKANEAAKSVKRRNDELAINVKDGDKYLYQHDAAKPSWFRNSQLPIPEKAKAIEEAKKLLKNAQNSYKVALDVDAADTEALMGMAKVARRLAEVKEEKNEPNTLDWTAAIDYLKKIIDKDANSARAYYNLACYLAISGKAETEALKALEKATELYPSLKAKANADPDFQELKKSSEFTRICGSI